MSKQIIFILGMHRSGTSALTRALDCLGVDIGTHTRGRFDNPRGFFEDEEFVAINRQVLHSLNLSWDALHSIDSHALNDLACGDLGKAAIDFLKKRHSPGLPLALKDPRAARLFPFWRYCAEKLGFAIYCLFSLRHPLSCAESLYKRDAMLREKGVFLWFLSMQDCLKASMGLPRLVVAYDLLLERPARELERIGYFLKLKVQEEKLKQFVTSFLDVGLRHHHYGMEKSSSQSLNLAMRFYATLEPCSRGLDADCLDSPRVRRILNYTLG